MRNKAKTGKLNLNGVTPEVHEYAAYLILIKSGKNLKLLPPSTKYKVHSADFEMDNLIWELKCPQGKGKYTIRDILRQAGKQSTNVVISLQRLKLNQEKALAQINKYFLMEKRLQRIMVIVKTKTIIDIQK